MELSGIFCCSKTEKVRENCNQIARVQVPSHLLHTCVARYVCRHMHTHTHVYTRTNAHYKKWVNPEAALARLIHIPVGLEKLSSFLIVRASLGVCVYVCGKAMTVSRIYTPASGAKVREGCFSLLCMCRRFFLVPRLVHRAHSNAIFHHHYRY